MGEANTPKKTMRERGLDMVKLEQQLGIKPMQFSFARSSGTSNVDTSVSCCGHVLRTLLCFYRRARIRLQRRLRGFHSVCSGLFSSLRVWPC